MKGGEIRSHLFLATGRKKRIQMHFKNHEKITALFWSLTASPGTSTLTAKSHVKKSEPARKSRDERQSVSRSDSNSKEFKWVNMCVFVAFSSLFFCLWLLSVVTGSLCIKSLEDWWTDTNTIYIRAWYCANCCCIMSSVRLWEVQIS